MRSAVVATGDGDSMNWTFIDRIFLLCFLPCVINVALCIHPHHHKVTMVIIRTTYIKWPIDHTSAVAPIAAEKLSLGAYLTTKGRHTPSHEVLQYLREFHGDIDQLDSL
jgi:hypothetical protein